MNIEEDTLDDLLNSVYNEVLNSGEEVKASKGSNLEIRNATLILRNPRARLSLAETKSTFISCLGEFFWYLSADDSIDFIEYYIKKYRQFIDFNEDESIAVPGAYGPRIFKGQPNQFEKIFDLLKRKRDSRRAVIALYSKEDLLRSDSRDIPCTCTLQFFIRNDRLCLTSYMRSNDAAKGLTHDIFSFTMIQEIMWAKLREHYSNLALGDYTHIVGSLHLYNDSVEAIKHYLNIEGWQYKVAMSPMNPKVLEENLTKIKDLEKILREETNEEVLHFLEEFDDLWKEIAIILLAWSYIKKNDQVHLKVLQEKCNNDPITAFLAKKIDFIESREVT